MNERIKELLDQATIDALFETQNAVDLLDNPVTKQQRQLQLEKFAELIVQECMRQVEEQYKPVLEDEAMMKDTHWAGYVQCGVDSYVAIREHFFGVE